MGNKLKLSMLNCHGAKAMGSVRPFWISWPLCCGVLWECGHTTRVNAGSQLCGLCFTWRNTQGVGFENLIGTLPHTDSIQLLPALSTCRRRHGENEQEQREHMNRRNRWGLFFINGVGVKLAGWAHVATHWIECLVYLGCVYRLRDDLVYSSEKTQWCSINVTNQPHQQFIRFYTDQSGEEGALNCCFKRRHCSFDDQMLLFVMVGFDCPFEPARFSYSCC